MDTRSFRDFAHHLLGAVQTDAIYPREHPRASLAVRELYLHATTLLQEDRIRIALVDGEFIVGDEPMPIHGDLLGSLAGVMERHGVARLIVCPGLQRWEAGALVATLNASPEAIRQAGGLQEALGAQDVQSILAGPITLGGGERLSSSLADAWDLYSAGLGAVRRLRARIEDGIDDEALRQATQLAGDMADAVHDHADAFVLLQALKKHDDYSYTHSLNVALMSATMARRMGLDEDLLHEVTLAALLHDIGKELVPDEVLNKPGKLSEEEWKIMQRHSADGAKMLMAAAAATDLAVVVAYEHQLAYERDSPDHGRWPLHLVSELICVADVYDALRSNRPYRSALPPGRAMRIMEDEAAEKFDPVIFAGFRRMIGHYPPGTVVELSDGCRALSVATHPDHVDRPRVLLVADPDGRLLEPPLPMDLSLATEPAVVASIDPDIAGIDPFDYI